MALEKAVITNTASKERIPVMFNPEEYTLNRENNFAPIAVPGLSAPIIQFVHGNQQTLEMELFLDTYEAHKAGNRTLNAAGDDVRKLVRKVTDLMNIDRTTHAPPVLLFTWSSLSFTCVLGRATQKFIMFQPDGTPVRARLTVTFNQYSNADHAKLHVLRQGETLAAVAAAVYGNPRLWRPIALRNRLEDPRRVAAGTQLAVPQLPYRDPDSGKVFQ
jgi:hypothetical protein